MSHVDLHALVEKGWSIDFATNGYGLTINGAKSRLGTTVKVSVLGPAESTQREFERICNAVDAQ